MPKWFQAGTLDMGNITKREDSAMCDMSLILDDWWRLHNQKFAVSTNIGFPANYSNFGIYSFPNISLKNMHNYRGHYSLIFE